MKETGTGVDSTRGEYNLATELYRMAVVTVPYVNKPIQCNYYSRMYLYEQKASNQLNSIAAL